jgi:hypothetical protein
MSVECSECERDLRGGHDLECSRFMLEALPQSPEPKEAPTLEDAETVYHVTAGDIWLQPDGSPLWEDDRDPAAILQPLGSELLRLGAAKVWYCEKCDRFQDSRSPCEADARFDERKNIASVVGDALLALEASDTQAGLKLLRGILESLEVKENSDAR